MEDEEYNKIVEYIKNIFKNKELEYLKNKFKKRMERDCKQDKDFREEYIQKIFVKFRICTKEEIENEYSGLKVSSEQGFYKPYRHLIWVDSNRLHMEKIIILIHECCHLISYYKDVGLWKNTYIDETEVLKNDFEREKIAYVNTGKFIKNEIKEAFPEIYKEIENVHKEHIEKTAENIKNYYGDACRELVRP